MQLTKNFTLAEFASKDGATTPPELFSSIQRLATNLQVLRDVVGKPIHINSGYRSPAHNAKIGGKTASFHLKGLAADIVISGMTPQQVRDKIWELIGSGEMTRGGLKAYNTFVHYDIRGWNATW